MGFYLLSQGTPKEGWLHKATYVFAFNGGPGSFLFLVATWVILAPKQNCLVEEH